MVRLFSKSKHFSQCKKRVFLLLKNYTRLILKLLRVIKQELLHSWCSGRYSYIYHRNKDLEIQETHQENNQMEQQRSQLNFLQRCTTTSGELCHTYLRDTSGICMNFTFHKLFIQLVLDLLYLFPISQYLQSVRQHAKVKILDTFMLLSS